MIGAHRRLTWLLFAVIVGFNLTVWEDQQFSYLAEAFLHGTTYLPVPPATAHDAVFFQGKYYWPLGPLPAVLLLPFVLIARFLGLFFFQSYLHVFLVFGVFYLFFKIAAKTGYSKQDSAFLAFAFCFASAFIGVAIYSGSGLCKCEPRPNSLDETHGGHIQESGCRARRQRVRPTDHHQPDRPSCADLAQRPSSGWNAVQFDLPG